MGSADGPVATGAQRAIDAAFETAARRRERILAWVRAVICVAMVVRSALIWSPSLLAIMPSRAWLIAPMLIWAALYIGGCFAVAHSQAPIEPLLKVSVALDSAAAFLALSANVRWPWPGYGGIVNMPDMVALTMATLAAGLRLSPAAALFGGILNSVSFVALALVDLHISGMPPPGMRADQYLLQGTLLSSAVVMSIIIAVRSRRLVDRAARAVLTAERAQRSFGTILHEHHDVRTLLSSARLNADRLAGEGPAAMRSLVNDLCSDLDEVAAHLNSIRKQAYGESLTLEVKYPVDVGEVAREVLGRLGRRFPAVALALHIEGRVEAEVAGGDATLRRLLFNLVINACEGDGESGAAYVDVRVRGDDAGRRVHIDIIDDGPGFSPGMLGTQLGETASTKAGGSGFGLGIALVIVQASDGTLTRDNGNGGGAVLSLSLPIAPSRSA